SVYTCKLPPVPSRFNLKATMVPGGPLNRRTRRTVGRLTGGRRVDMKDESHKVCAFSSHEYCPWCPPYTTPTATLECIAKICPCKMAVLQGPVTRSMSV